MWSFALDVKKNTLERLDKEKRRFKTGFKFINNTSVNLRIIN